MAPLSKLLPPLALVGALAMVPVATTAFAAAETDTQKELETFFSVFEPPGVPASTAHCWQAEN